MKELKKLHVDYTVLLSGDIGLHEVLLHEIAFLTESAGLLTDLQACGVKIGFGRNDGIQDMKYAVDVPKTVEKYKLGYTDPVVVNREGISNKVLAALGMPAIIR